MSIRVPFLKSVVPPHVFCLLSDGVTYARVRSDEPAGFEEVRHFRYPAGSAAPGPSGSSLPTREAIAEAVKAARALAGGRLARASVVFPDAWTRIMAVELDAFPDQSEAGREMILWKLKKLLPGHPTDLSIVYRPMPELAEEKRVLIAATPRETVEAIERAFDESGVRIGYLAPAGLALFEGLASTLAAAASGDFALLHRTGNAMSFFIARGTAPIFYRQRPAETEEEHDHDREARLSLSYYAEKLKGPGLSAVYVHDELPDHSLERLAAFAVPAVPVSGRLFSADRGFDERVAARPELLAGFAAVWGGR